MAVVVAVMMMRMIVVVGVIVIMRMGMDMVAMGVNMAVSVIMVMLMSVLLALGRVAFQRRRSATANRAHFPPSNSSTQTSSPAVQIIVSGSTPGKFFSAKIPDAGPFRP
jgi:hypothetical protein